MTYGLSRALTVGSGTASTSGTSTTVVVGSTSGMTGGMVIAFYPATQTHVYDVLYRVISSVNGSTSVTVDRAIALSAKKYAFAGYQLFTGVTGAGGVNDISHKILAKTTVADMPGHQSFDSRIMDIMSNTSQTITVKGQYFGSSIDLGTFKVNIHEVQDGSQYKRNALLYMSDCPDLGTFVYLDTFTWAIRVELKSGSPLGAADFSLNLIERRLAPY